MWRVRTVFQGVTGSPYLSTLYFKDDLGGSFTAQEAVNGVAGLWGSIDFYMNTSVNWATEAEVAVVNPVNGQATGVEVTTPATGAGGTGGDTIPWASQGLVRWRTGEFVAGREIRGRMFIPALSEVACSVGVPSAAFITAVNAALTTYITDAETAPIIWSKKNGSIHLINSGTCWGQFATLRSRRD